MTADVLEDVAEHAVLAPSSHNSQPWRISVDHGFLTIRADRSRALPVADPSGRELVISCGAALFNARVAAGQLAGAVEWKAFPDPEDPELLGRLSVGEPVPGPADAAVLFDAIPKRRTYRRPFADRELPPATISALEDAARGEHAWLRTLDPTQRTIAADLVAEGDRLQWADRAWRSELAGWMRPRRAGDGLTAGALTRLVVRRFDLGGRMAQRDRELAMRAPVLALLETAGDTPPDWLAAGQALEAVLLRAAASGLQASFLNQPTQVPPLRARLRAALGNRGHPQLLLRIGFPVKDVPVPPRRRPAP